MRYLFLLICVALLLCQTACSSPDRSLKQALTTERQERGLDGKSVDGLNGTVRRVNTLPPLPAEQLGKVMVLPEHYPESWILVNELSFFSMYGGRIIILDAGETLPSKRIKGIINKYLAGNYAQSKKRNEIYVLETFHERGARGKRTDVLAIYDKSSLKIKKEIVWREANRLMALPERYAISLSKDEKYLYASNFSPATSFTVIDLDKQAIIDEIGTPGCVLTYPTGNRGVASICSNGAMLSTVLKEDGTLDKQQMSSPFFDTMDTPIFEHPVYFGSKAYFPSFHGLLHVFDVNGDIVKYEGSWDMVSPSDKKDNWRPSGLILNDVDDSGLMYTIFQRNASDGSYASSGDQVWVFDLKKRKRIKVIDMINSAISITVTRGKKPLLAVTNGDLKLDIFNANTGEYIQTLDGFGNMTPLALDKSF